jgi:hypothetical protein
MGELANAIAEIKLREIAKAESALAEQLGAPTVELDDEAKRNLLPFLEWTTEKNVRCSPSLPTTIGMFIIEQSGKGIPEQKLLDQVAAIEQLHDSLNLPSPVATSAVGFALEQAVKSEPPRSWTKAEKGRWAALPPEIRAVIKRRDVDQERQMRRAHNRAADAEAELKRLSETAADTKPVKIKESVQDNG